VILLPWYGDREQWLDHMHRLIAKYPEEVTEVECDLGTRYATAIADLWGKSEHLIIVEHDIWPTPKQWKALLLSTELMTVFPYTFNKDAPPHWTQGTSVATHGGQLRVNDKWADGSGLGLIKFSAEAMRRIDLNGPLAEAGGAVQGVHPNSQDFRTRHWGNLDGVISLLAQAAGVRFAVLWPIVKHKNILQPEWENVGKDGIPPHWNIELVT
jgi:hypothetical protein